MIVIDASALAELLLGTQAAGAVRNWIQPGDRLHAPHLIDVEIAQVMRRLTASTVPLTVKPGMLVAARDPARLSLPTRADVIGRLDPIKRLFASSGPEDGANPEDAARARSIPSRRFRPTQPTGRKPNFPASSKGRATSQHRAALSGEKQCGHIGKNIFPKF